MVCAVTEGEDKPLKYPLMFRTCELVVINKIDLLEHLDFDLDRFLYNLDAVNPGVRRMLVSARTGQGVDEFRGWLAELRDRTTRAANDVHSIPASGTRSPSTVGAA
jgi:hydrogenase nickel incorporation protein HypB